MSQFDKDFIFGKANRKIVMLDADALARRDETAGKDAKVMKTYEPEPKKPRIDPLVKLAMKVPLPPKPPKPDPYYDTPRAPLPVEEVAPDPMNDPPEDSDVTEQTEQAEPPTEEKPKRTYRKKVSDTSTLEGRILAFRRIVRQAEEGDGVRTEAGLQALKYLSEVFGDKEKVNQQAVAPRPQHVMAHLIRSRIKGESDLTPIIWARVKEVLIRSGVEVIEDDGKNYDWKGDLIK